MPAKKNSRKGLAGSPGLERTANQDQSPNQTMGTESSSVATGEPSLKDAHLEAGLAVINAFDNLYEQPADKAVKDSDMPPQRL